MLKRLRVLLTGRRTPADPAAASAARVEGLEKRSLMSVTVETSAVPTTTVEVPPVSAAADPDVTGPRFVKTQLIGADPRRVEGVVLTFDEPLDEASAEDLRNYRVGRRTDRRQRFGDDFDDRFRSNRGLVRFESATYDPATFSVTLVARDPFNLTRRFRNVRVLGRADLGVRDVAGNVLDGNEDGAPGKDAIKRYTFSRGDNIRYGEVDGDNVGLSLTGPGRLWVFRQTPEGKVLARGDAFRVFVDDAVSGQTTVTGRITGNAGDGFNSLATIDQITNPGGAADLSGILNNPEFQIGNVVV